MDGLSASGQAVPSRGYLDFSHRFAASAATNSREEAQ
jgi:hypothetical protein